MARSTKPWKGRTDDSKPPAHVRQRIFDANDGICHICSLPIKTGETWHLDHVIALIEGGPNEEGNLKPAHAHCNLAKANGEKTRKSKVNRTRQKHLGIVDPPKMESRGFQPTRKSAERKAKAEQKIDFTQRRNLYRSA